jgi:hypothetical protein
LILSPVLLTYWSVAREWNLRRGIDEIESFSADLISIALGSPNLVFWPLTTPAQEIAGYPGIVIAGLIVAAMVIAYRDRHRDRVTASWRRVAVRALSMLSMALFAAGVVAAFLRRTSYKLLGIAIDLGLIAVLLSARFTALVRSGSLLGLYGTGFVASLLLALGPEGRVSGHRFWYKPPFAWLMQLPGVDGIRVPARFAAVEILCLAVIAALAFTRIWPAMNRRSAFASLALASAIVLDGWAPVPVVQAPRPLGVAVTADLVVELPAGSSANDVAAMYRGTMHGRPVVNGYSGFIPPHYRQLQKDLLADCVTSLEPVREGRSIDTVIWKASERAAALDTRVRELWPAAIREETTDVIVYRQPRSPVRADLADVSCKPQV